MRENFQDKIRHRVRRKIGQAQKKHPEAHRESNTRGAVNRRRTIEGVRRARERGAQRGAGGAR